MTGFKPRLITKPASTPVSLDQLKVHLGIDDNEHDAVLTLTLAAATARLDGWGGVLRMCLMEQVWEQAYPTFGPVLRLPLGPVSSIVSIIYADIAGADQTLAESAYVRLEDAIGEYIAPAPNTSWPTVGTRYDGVRVRFRAGAAAAADVDPSIRTALLMLAGHLYRFPDAATDVSGLPPVVRMMLGDKGSGAVG